MTLDPLEFLVTFLPSETRRLTRTGVQMHNLQYWAESLGQWVGQHRNVQVHYDPRDITVAYIRSPAGVIVTAKSTTPDITAISLAEWEARRNYERALGRDPRLVARADASQKRGDLLVSEAKASRRVRRRKATEAAGDRWLPETAVPTAPDRDDIPLDTPDAPHAVAIPVITQLYSVEGCDDDD